MNSYKLCLFFETSAPARAGHYLVYSVKPFRHWQQPEIVFALPFPEGSPPACQHGQGNLCSNTNRLGFCQFENEELAEMKARLEQIRHKMKRNHEAGNADNVSVAFWRNSVCRIRPVIFYVGKAAKLEAPK